MEFNEYIIKRKKGAKEIWLSVLLYMAASVVALIPLILLLPVSPQIATLLSFGCFYFAYKFSTGMNKEFEYIFTKDNICIDTIIHRSRRKRLISFSLSDVEIIASTEDEKHNSLLKSDFGRTIDATSRNGHLTVYFAVIAAEKRTLLKFEPPVAALESIYKYAPSKIHIHK